MNASQETTTRLTPTESKGKCCLADVFLGRRGCESDPNGRARRKRKSGRGGRNDSLLFDDISGNRDLRVCASHVVALI